MYEGVAIFFFYYFLLVCYVFTILIFYFCRRRRKMWYPGMIVRSGVEQATEAGPSQAAEERTPSANQSRQQQNSTLYPAPIQDSPQQLQPPVSSIYPAPEEATVEFQNKIYGNPPGPSIP